MITKNQVKLQNQKIGVLNVYKVKSVLPKKQVEYGKILPLIFRLRLKQGAEPVYMNYQTIRESFPLILLAYFEQKVHIKFKDQDLNSYFPTNNKYLCDNSFDSIEIRVLPEQQMREYKKSKKDSDKNRQVKEIRETIRNNELESCQNSRNNKLNQSEDKRQLKILDYDDLVQQQCHLNLIIPAVIPSTTKKCQENNSIHQS